jgi:hypothetical protein
MERVQYLIGQQPKIEWLVEGAVAAGCIHLLSGTSYNLIRTIAVRMAIAIAKGEPFCGAATKPVGAGYLHPALGEHVVASMFEKAGVEGNPAPDFEGLQVFTSGGGVNAFSRLHGDDHARVVFIDNLECFQALECREHPPGMHEWQSLARTLRELRNRARDRRVCYVLLHQERKETEMVRGAMAVYGIVDGTLSVRHGQGSLRGIDIGVQHRNAHTTRLHLSASR